MRLVKFLGSQAKHGRGRTLSVSLKTRASVKLDGRAVGISKGGFAAVAGAPAWHSRLARATAKATAIATSNAFVAQILSVLPR
mmetsp:Transcript_83117/g.193081  ORF Transcript_83117/g.193081 Transcript_83117/m.193081 type:complete len:83 (-) Transcript_83117:34-282(-)